MIMELRQQLRLSQQLVMTPQLQMAIKLLQLSRLELVDTIRQEIEENPVLEEEFQDVNIEEHQLEPLSLDAKAEDIKEVVIEESIGDKIAENVEWGNYFDEETPRAKVQFETEEKDSPEFETFIAGKESLNDHLLWQFLMTSPTKEDENIGSVIIGNLNKDGYLELSVDEIAKINGSSLSAVEKVLSLLQTFDPSGVCARDLTECLLIQIKQLGIESTIISEIIKNHLHNLENKNYKAISKALKIKIEDVVATVNIIKGLEPRPGRRFSDEEPMYINPDIFVYKVENDFVIIMNDDGMPKLRVNNLYKETIGKGKAIAENAKNYLQDKMRSATWLIRSIHQRQKTIYRVMESILKFQRDFFEKGIAYLKPLVLRDVAQDINMHESTVSRVTTNKYAYTPQGIFELKFFFNSSINRVQGMAIASTSVKDKIRQIIESENPKKPYSDEEISAILKDSNIEIARRTVAKYRELLRVLPSNKRKQF
ncbi:MAG: RNA polymerase factor sigma-54 [Desulfobacterales bacterium]|nr:RNA polymerase factor sigma-54 [Desulfobacterales bacterium]